MPRKVGKKKVSSTDNCEGAFNNVDLQSTHNRESSKLPEVVEHKTNVNSDPSITNSISPENSKTPSLESITCSLGKRKNCKKIKQNDNSSSETEKLSTQNIESNQMPIHPKDNSISFNGAENSMDGINTFHFGKGMWITTTRAVTTTDIQKYFEKQMASKSFPPNSNLTVFCGHHGVKDKDKDHTSRMGGSFSEFTSNLRIAFKNVEEK